MKRVAEWPGCRVASRRGEPSGKAGNLGNRATRQPFFAMLLALALLLAAPAAHACPVCFGSPDTPTAHGMNNAILFLLSMVGFVQIGFVALFWSFWRRARALRRQREQFHLIEGGVR